VEREVEFRVEFRGCPGSVALQRVRLSALSPILSITRVSPVTVTPHVVSALARLRQRSSLSSRMT